MTILTLLEYPDPRLYKKALPVENFDKKIEQIVNDMFETMYHENGVGLAATQVDIQQRIIVIDTSENRNNAFCIINPEIIEKEGIQFETEGCLSFPGMYDKVERAAKVKVRGFDQHGKVFELEAEELLAICLQHEIDHLDGILFIDHLSRLKQTRIKKKLEKFRRCNA